MTGLYLGRLTDPASGALTPEELRLDAADLTTHGVVIGMTGSGKTGLCIDLLEEAALTGIPALVIDPKGDMGNLLLTFPELRPEDFTPWLPPGEAERKRLSADEYAAEVARSWRAGLAEWGLNGERIRELRETADFTVYTPGSRAGVPVDVLSSFSPPALSWATDEEALRDAIRFSVTALLTLVGIDADPLQSREHIFLSHLVETAWRSGAPSDLGALIRGLQQPPFERLGVFEVESFYPLKERMKLAIALNGVLAAPGFAPWMQGEALDPASLLRTSDGRPRVAIFYLGHLSEREKLFFTTLLLSAANVWMRRQGGTTDLRALVYIDEVVGMIPPHPANPPTKEILLLLMKQARAFGLGMVLTTQNPVDMDYKVLTNAGTWFVGRLQTQQDKDRVLEGMMGAGGAAGASRAELDARIGALPKRSFILYSARGGSPRTFQSRWAMSYLRGPLTREEVQRLSRRPAAPAMETAVADATATAGYRARAQQEVTDVGAAPSVRTPESLERPSPAAPGARGAQAVPPSAADPVAAGIPGSATARAAAQETAGTYLPPLESGDHLFLTTDGLRGLGATRPAPDFLCPSCRYVPGLYAAATVRYDETRAGLNVTERAERLIFPITDAEPRWSESRVVEIGLHGSASTPPVPGRFEPLPPGLLKKGVLNGLKRGFTDHLVGTAVREMYVAPALRLYSRYDESRPEFEARVAREQASRREAEMAKLRDRYAAKLSALQRRLEKERSDVAGAEASYAGRKREEMVSGAESLFGFVLGRRTTRAVSQATRQRRITETARLKLDKEKDDAAAAERELEMLSARLEPELAEIDARYAAAETSIETLDVPLERDDVTVETFGVLWIPVAAASHT